jgi:hypothetical protein
MSELVELATLADHTDEWVDHVLSAGAEGLRPVVSAVKIAPSAAPRIALRLRFRPFARRYVLPLLLVATDGVRADAGETRRGSRADVTRRVVEQRSAFLERGGVAAVAGSCTVRRRIWRSHGWPELQLAPDGHRSRAEVLGGGRYDARAARPASARTASRT